MSIRYTSEQLQGKYGLADSGFAFARKADSLREEGHVEEAIALCTQEIRKHPDYLTGRLVAARCLLESDRLRPAREEYEAALRLDPRCLAAWKGLAQVLARMQDEGAESCLARIHEIDPWYEMPTMEVGEFQARQPTPAEPPGAPEDRTLEFSLDDVGDYLPISEEDTLTLEPEPGLSDPFENLEEGVSIEGDQGDGENPVSGQDVEERLDSIFGEESPLDEADSTANSSVPESGFNETVMLDRKMETSDSHDRSGAELLSHLEDATETTFQPFPQAPARDEATEKTSESAGSVTGEDVVDHLDRFFQEEESPSGEVSETLPSPPDEIAESPEPEAAIEMDAAPKESDTLSGIVSGFEFLEGDEAVSEEKKTPVSESGGMALDSMQDWLMGTESSPVDEALETPQDYENPTTDENTVESIAETTGAITEESERPIGSDTEAFAIAGPGEGDPSIEELSGDLEARLDELFGDDGAGLSESPTTEDSGSEEQPVPETAFPESSGAETMFLVRTDSELDSATPDFAPLVPEPDSDEVQETVDLRRDPFSAPEKHLDEPALTGLFKEPFSSDTVEPEGHNLFEEETPVGKSGEDPEIVDGDDVTQRLNELFGSHDGPEEGGAPGLESAIFEEPAPSQDMEESALTVSEDTGEPVDEDFGAQPEPILAEEAGDGQASETQVVESEKPAPMVSGDDISSRLAQMFGDEGVPTEQEPADSPSTEAASALTGMDTVQFSPEEMGITPASTGEIEAEEEPLEEEDGEAIPTNVATVTLAEIYFQQGLKEQALQIYRQLLDREPENEAAKKRIAEIEASKTEEDSSEDDASDMPGRQPRGVRPGTRPGSRSGRPPRRRG